MTRTSASVTTIFIVQIRRRWTVVASTCMMISPSKSWLRPNRYSGIGRNLSFSKSPPLTQKFCSLPYIADHHLNFHLNFSPAFPLTYVTSVPSLSPGILISTWPPPLLQTQLNSKHSSIATHSISFPLHPPIINSGTTLIPGSTFS